MAIQIRFSSPPPDSRVPTAIADGSNLPPGAPIVRDAPRCRQADLGGKQMANRASSTTKKILAAAAAGLALGLGSLGVFASAGTAAATTPTSTYPADPTWPAPPSWGSHPADPTWPSPPSWGSWPAESTWGSG
jgi:hypothetical protein